jgi:hypothetical protein
MRKHTARPLRLRNTQWQAYCLQNDAFWPQHSEANTYNEGSNSEVAKRFMSSAYVTLCSLSNILVTDVVQ